MKGVCTGGGCEGGYVQEGGGVKGVCTGRGWGEGGMHRKGAG